jgi:hypothetical protein
MPRVLLAPCLHLAWPLPGQDAADLLVINAHADELNTEAEDALTYQVPL